MASQAERLDGADEDDAAGLSLVRPEQAPSPDAQLSRLDRVVVKLISLGVVVLGFAVAVGAPWYVKPLGVPTILLGICIFCYPDPREHLRLWRRRDGPVP